MSLFRRGDVLRYEFWFAGRRIQESSKTIARAAEQNVADEFFSGYKLRLPNSAVFADYDAIAHLKRLLGNKMLVDLNEAAVIKTLQGTCLETDTQALQPHSHGSEADGARIDCQKTDGRGAIQSTKWAGGGVHAEVLTWVEKRSLAAN
jgi:hypothetical protein